MKKEIKKQINKIIETSNKSHKITINDIEDTKYNSLKQLRDELDILLGLYYKNSDKSKIEILNMLIGECEKSAFGAYYLYNFYTYYKSIVSSIKYYMDKFKQEEGKQNEN
jgi:hypothetical protein